MARHKAVARKSTNFMGYKTVAGKAPVAGLKFARKAAARVGEMMGLARWSAAREHAFGQLGVQRCCRRPL